MQNTKIARDDNKLRHFFASKRHKQPQALDSERNLLECRKSLNWERAYSFFSQSWHQNGVHFQNLLGYPVSYIVISATS